MSTAGASGEKWATRTRAAEPWAPAATGRASRLAAHSARTRPARRSSERGGMGLQEMTTLGTRLAGGDSRAVEDVYGALGPRVLSYLRRLVPYDDAEDVMQRVFFEVWRSRDRFDPDRSLEAWVFAIARKRAIDHLRRPHHVTVPIDLVRDLAGADGRGCRQPGLGPGGAPRPRPPRGRAAGGAGAGVLRGRTQVEIASELGLPPATPRPSRKRVPGWPPPRVPRPSNPTGWAGARLGRAGGA